jgi:hypothetical protein
MRVARWRWLLVPMIVLLAGCLSQPGPHGPPVPASSLQAFSVRGLGFTMSEPPPGHDGPSRPAGPLQTRTRRAEGRQRTTVAGRHLRSVVVRPTAVLRRAPAAGRLGHRLPRRGATVGRLGRVGRTRWRLLPVGWRVTDPGELEAAWGAVHDIAVYGVREPGLAHWTPGSLGPPL